MQKSWPVVVWAMLMFGIVITVDSNARLLNFGRGAPGGGSTPITSMNFAGPVHKYNTTHYPPNYVIGDSWYHTWGDDGKVYALAGDSAIQGETWGDYQHIRLMTVTNWDATATLTTVPPNFLLYPWGTLSNNNTNPKESYKNAGIICIKDAGPGRTPAMYMVTRLFDDLYWRWFHKLQIIKSYDHGASWTPVPPGLNLPYPSPMWPGAVGPTAFFQYGQCYAGNGPHRSDEFVYSAMENNDLGHMAQFAVEEMYLARVRVDRIDALNAADWQYYQGGDGMDDKNWTSNINTVAKILDGRWYKAPRRVGVHYGGFQYLPAFREYVYIGGVNLSDTEYSINMFASPTPWGPWRLLRQVISVPEKWAWQSPIMPSITLGGKFTVIQSGRPDTWLQPPNQTYYQPVFQDVQVTGHLLAEQ